MVIVCGGRLLAALHGPPKGGPYEIKMIWISPTFVLVGPVRTRSPRRSKKGYVSLLSRYRIGSLMPAAAARANDEGSTSAPAASVGPSIPSVPMLAPATDEPI